MGCTFYGQEVAMLVSTWRLKVKSFMDRYLTVGSWELKKPVKPGDTTCFIEPLRDVDYFWDGTQVLGEASQHVYILGRLPDDKFHLLPVGYWEGIHGSISQILLTQTIPWGLQTLTLNPLDRPVQFSEATESYGDWLVELHWVFRITWQAEVEAYIQPQPAEPIDIVKISGGLYRQNLDGTDIVLDQIITRQPTRLTENDELLKVEDNYITNQ